MKIRFLARLGSLAVVMVLAGCMPQPVPQLVSTTPEPAELNVADAAIAGGDPAMALSVSQSVLKDNPGDVDALVHEGDSYYALGRCQDSEAAYELALAHDSGSAAAETGLGRCLIKTDPAGAERALEQAVADDPGDAAALNDLGIARDLQGNFAGAVDPYRRALLAQPGMVAAEVNLGLSLALSGHGPEALQYLGPLATGPGADAKTREDYAAALVAVGRLDEARQVLSVDLPPAQVSAAIDGFSAVIANAQPPLVDQQAAPPPASPVVSTSPIETTPIAPAAAPVTTPAPAPAAPPPVVAAKTIVTPTPMPDSDGGGSFQVQLGALSSQDGAQSAWDSLSGDLPALFGDKQPDIVSATVNGRVYYRLRTGSFDSKSEAAKFCGEVAAAGHACTLANF